MSRYTPTPADKFTFGLWTVANAGRDPFGDATRTPVKPCDAVRRLAALGAYGVNLHDNDLVPFEATAADRDRIVKEFKTALAENGLTVPMATTNLFYHPVFKDGAFTSNDASVRAFALRKTMDSMDLGAELGAKIYVFWGGREGAEVDASKDPVTALKRFRDALNFLCGYVKDKGYGMQLALEAKPNEPRGDIFLPTTGAMLGFIETLDDPSMVGVNPELAHETMAGLNFHHAVAQAIEAGKLFHIDLNGQKPGRYDQDLRFGSEDAKGAFFLVRLLENSGYSGSRHFDAHAYRTSDPDDVWSFAAGCMKTYLILKEKARQFDADPRVQQLLAQTNACDPAAEAAITQPYSREAAQRIRSLALDPMALAAKPLPYEALDQRLFEILHGIAD